MILLRLYWEFFKTGLFAVGGGLATLPFLYELSDRTGWFTHNDLTNMIAVSESTPGPIGVNVATYVGFTVDGLLGAIIATLGLITPSIIIILLIAAVLKNFRDNRFVNGAFYGLRPASTAMIAASGLTVAAAVFLHGDVLSSGLTAVNWKGLGLAVLIYVLTNHVERTKSLHPIVFIGFSAVVGIVFGLF